jgi:hypothetical protein
LRANRERERERRKKKTFLSLVHEVARHLDGVGQALRGPHGPEVAPAAAHDAGVALDAPFESQVGAEASVAEVVVLEEGDGAVDCIARQASSR